MEEKRIQLSEKDVAESFSLSLVWEKNKVLIILGLVGLILMGIGTFSLLLFHQKEPEIQIIPSTEENQKTIFVHLEGAVEKPGVYELSMDSRLNDLLILAGGLSVQADREWVEMNLNLAQKLVDGGKIYIPFESERVKEQESGKLLGIKTLLDKINLNQASLSELDSLWGIGEKRAADIVKNRPYQTVEELVKRKIIPQNVYEKIKDEVVVY